MQGAFDRDQPADPAIARELAKSTAAKVQLAEFLARPQSANPRSATSIGRSTFQWRDDPDIARMVNDHLAGPTLL